MKKILIIEDEETMKNSLGEIFMEEGFDVQTASDGEEGYDMIKNGNADIVLLDIILPKMDGFEIMEKLSKEKVKHPPIIILTNLSDVENVQKAINFGANTYLIKSDYQLSEIVEKVKAILK